MMSFDNVLYDNLEADPVLMQPLDFPIDDKQPLPEVKYRVDFQDITLGGVGQGILIKWVVGVESRMFRTSFCLPSSLLLALAIFLDGLIPFPTVSLGTNQLCFPELGSGCFLSQALGIIYMFSHAWHQLHIFPHLVFTYIFTCSKHRLQVFPYLADCPAPLYISCTFSLLIGLSDLSRNCDSLSVFIPLSD